MKFLIVATSLVTLNAAVAADLPRPHPPPVAGKAPIGKIPVGKPVRRSRRMLGSVAYSLVA
jgi:hypothetical protein